MNLTDKTAPYQAPLKPLSQKTIYINMNLFEFVNNQWLSMALDEA